MSGGTRIAVTMGDPAGIGPEIVAACMIEPLKDSSAVVIGDAAALRRALAERRSDWAVRVIQSPNDVLTEPLTINVIEVGQLSADVVVGNVDA